MTYVAKIFLGWAIIVLVAVGVIAPLVILAARIVWLIIALLWRAALGPWMTLSGSIFS